MNKLLLLAAFGALIAGNAAAEVFKSRAQCVLGKRVADKADKVGTIVTGGGKDDTLCFVHLDGTAKDAWTTYIFWMLRDAGASVETDDKLVSGVYECFSGSPNSYTFVDLRISGDTYEWGGSRGKLRVEMPSRKIVFASGPLMRATSKLLKGPSVGLNTDGGTFFGTHCDLAKK